MTVERLPFDGSDVPHHSRSALRHAAPYAAVKSIVAGKRVLDVGCGEGHGARLLRNWGAREVVGIDFSQAAIAAARRAFGGGGISFLVGEAEELENAIGGAGPFDLIVALETIRHLARPERVLASLPRLLATNGAIVIGCPNDTAVSAGYGSPFHPEVHSFEAFKSLTQRYLGEASMWMPGTPLPGASTIRASDRAAQDKHEADAASKRNIFVENAAFLPAESNPTAVEHSCSHYIGVWGTANVVPDVVVGSLPVPSGQEPGRDNSSARVRGLEQAVETLEAEKAALEDRIGSGLEPEIVQLSSEADMLRTALSDAAEEREDLRRKLQAAETALSDMKTRQAEYFEPELAKLRAHVEHSTFEKEVQFLRSRLMTYAERLRRAGETVAALQQRLQETEEARDFWFRPEIDRLNGIIAEYETTKREWWDPQLEARAARIAELQSILEKR